MKTYRIEVRLSDSEIFEIEAESEKEAIRQAKEAYEAGFEYDPLFELEGLIIAHTITDVEK